MKGATIDLSDSPTFGTLQSLGFAGNFEFAIVEATAPSRIRLRNRIVRNYQISDKVQLVRISSHSGDVQVTGTVTGQPWNGVTGGIIVIEAAGNISLSANIDATGIGFRADGRFAKNAGTPDQTGYKYPYDSDSAGGWKGESIAEFVRTAESGRGPQYAGGGGGNNQNAGGGGGGNGGRGGLGGDQTDFNITRLPLGGLGGIPIDYTLANQRLFLGSNGGWGHENDGRGTNGGAGGGLIIIKATSIQSAGGSIIAKGVKPDTSGNDGSGGGGAGGTVLVTVANAPGGVTIDVTGGEGGNTDAGLKVGFDQFCYGPGGGGGGGFVKYPASVSNVNVIAKGGKAGIVTNPNTPCYQTSYGAADGLDGATNNDVTIPEGTAPFAEPVLDQHDIIICEGDSARPRVTGPAIVVDWTPRINISNPASLSPELYPTTSGTYVVSMQDARGCTFIDSVRITVNPRPKPLVDGPDTVCSFTTHGYTVTNIQSSSIKKWIVRGGQIIGNDNLDTVTIRWDETLDASIAFESSEDGSCVGIDSMKVMVYPTRKVILLGVRDMCSGDSVEVIAEPGYDAYLWSTGDTLDRIMIGDSGTYFVQVFGGGPCITRFDTFHVSIRNPQQPQITASRDTITSPCQQVQLDAGAGYLLYQWSTGDTSRAIATLDSGRFIVTVTDSIGCVASDTIDILRQDNGASRFTIKLDTLEAYAGDLVYYPVRVVSSENQLLECVGDYRVVVHFNRSLLVPQQPFLWDELQTRLRYVAFGTDFGPNISATELPGISFIATLGDTSETPIVIDSFYWDNKVVDYVSYDGLFRLLGICEEGDTRYVYTQGIQYLTTPTPNPASTSMKFGYSTIEPGLHEVILVDVMGRVMREIYRGSTEPTKRDVTLDVSDLPAGQYFLVMRTPSTVFKRAVHISR